MLLKNLINLPFVAIAFTVLIGTILCQNDTTTTTTTPAPNVTTTTTLKPTTTSTTVAPTTTPKPITTSTTTTKPTPTPTPTPKSEQISGNITEGTHTCIRFEMTSINLLIQYTKVDNKIAVANVSFPISSTEYTSPNGTCSSPVEQFTLFTGDSSKNTSANITFGFTSNSNSVVLQFLKAQVQYSPDVFVNISQNEIGKYYEKTLNETTPNFNVEKSHSYSCAHVSIPKTDSGDFHVSIVGLRIQAFMEASKNGQFSSEHNCQSEINDVVPIAVGIALTCLVIIVMVAYFIGRRRSRRLAYQSV